MPRPPKTPDTEGLMTWAEIGRRLDMTPQEVRTTYNRAIRKLRDALEEQGISAHDLDLIRQDRQRLPDPPEELAAFLLATDKPVVD